MCMRPCQIIPKPLLPSSLAVSPSHVTYTLLAMPISDGTMHIVLFPFPAQGHFAAFLSLAGLLHRARPAAAISLVSTPRSVSALRSSSSASAPFLRFHSIPFDPVAHGLPAGAESADALPARHFITLFEASESLEPGFDGYVRSACSDVAGAPAGASVIVVADPFLAWTTAVARRHGAAHAFFDSCGAFGSAVYHSLWTHLPHLRARRDGEASFCLPDHPEVSIDMTQLPRHLLDADGTDRRSLFLRRQLSLGYDTDAVIINTVEELEPAGLRMLRRTMGVPVLPVGPLVRVPAPRSDDDVVIHWLDAHAPSSVLYVSFGSQNTIRPEQMMELAAALESTGRPFVWAVRPPVGFDIRSEFDAESWLPEGFEERLRASGKGLLVRGWAPQVRILAHASTGAFLSHCGWNSVLESVTLGVPIVAWPISAEQFYNAKMMAEEWGVCVEVARGNMESSAVETAKVAEAVETVMGDASAKGAEMRRRVREMKELVGGAREGDHGGSSAMDALEEFFASTLRH